MRLIGKWRARLLRSPVYLLLSGPATTNSTTAGSSASGTALMSSSPQRKFGVKRQFQQSPGDGESVAGARDWLWLLRRRLVVACRPRNLAKIFGAVLVALLLVLIVTKGYSARRRGTCKCAKFSYSQCQPYDGVCGQGVKKAFCQQKRCMPRRKLVRCTASCDRTDGPSDTVFTRIASACSYGVRRQSHWTRCPEGAEHRSRILFLQAGSPAGCPPTRTERRSCKTKQPAPGKSCTYEPRGHWTACNRERNEIVNTRQLVDGGAGAECPIELRTTMRCLRRDGSLRCIYSKWTKWSPCVDGSRHKTRTLVQGLGCAEATRLAQNCSRRVDKLADTVIVK